MPLEAGSSPSLTSGSRPVVVLACSDVEARAMVDVARGLIGLGVRVDVVPGVDLDARPLELATEQHRGDTLWVLCRSEELDEYQLELLTLTVRANEVPSDRIIAPTLSAGTPEGIHQAVRERLVALGWIGPEPGAPGPTTDPASTPVLTPSVANPASRAARASLRLLGVGAVGLLAVFAWTGLHDVKLSPIALASAEPAVAALATEVAPASDRAAPARERAEPARERAEPARDRAEPAAIRTPRAVQPTGVRSHDPLGTALASRTIRALDALLIATPLPAPARPRRARSICNQLHVAGIDAWRLPTAPEVSDLGDAGFLAADAPTWTRAKKKTKRALWTGERVRMRPASRRDEATVVCVAVSPA